MSKTIQKWIPCDIKNCNRKASAKFKKQNNEWTRNLKSEFPFNLCITHEQEFNKKLKETYEYMDQKNQEYKDMLKTMTNKNKA